MAKPRAASLRCQGFRLNAALRGGKPITVLSQERFPPMRKDGGRCAKMMIATGPGRGSRIGHIIRPPIVDSVCLSLCEHYLRGDVRKHREQRSMPVGTD